MKKFSFFFCFVLIFQLAAAKLPPQNAKWLAAPDKSWHLHYDAAMNAAKKQKKQLLVLSTCSDGNASCDKLQKEVFNSPEFKAMAAPKLILLYLDVPQKKKLPKDQIQHNTEVRKMLKFHGTFPEIKVFNPDGKEVGGKVGYTQKQELIIQLQQVLKKNQTQTPAAKKQPAKPAPKKPAPKKPAPPANTQLAALDKGKFMRIISMGTDEEGKAMYFPQKIVLLVGEHIYFQFRCNIPNNKTGKIQIHPTTGNNYHFVDSDTGEGDCLLTVGISSKVPQRCRTLNVRMIPIDSNKWLDHRKIPVDIEWIRPRTK